MGNNSQTHHVLTERDCRRRVSSVQPLAGYGLPELASPTNKRNDTIYFEKLVILAGNPNGNVFDPTRIDPTRTVFIFVLILIGVMAGVAFIMSQRRGQSIGNALLESCIWGSSLIACAGGDYLLAALNSNHAWI